MTSDAQKILIQLDIDAQCSTFDAVVAVDSGADHLFRHGQVTEDQVTSLVHGAMFTRSTRKLASTAIFVGGSDADQADRIYRKVLNTFFGPVRVSVAMDASGCNTTSVAAVKMALDKSKELNLELSSSSAIVLGSTGAVGRRVAQLLFEQGIQVICHSRSQDKADRMIAGLKESAAHSHLENLGTLRSLTVSDRELAEVAANCDFVFGAGAAGIQFINQDHIQIISDRTGILVDLNAVPPSGIHGVEPTCNQWMGKRFAFGALTVGSLKMQLHKEVIRQCFLSNDGQFNLREIFQMVDSMSL